MQNIKTLRKFICFQPEKIEVEYQTRIATIKHLRYSRSLFVPYACRSAHKVTLILVRFLFFCIGIAFFIADHKNYTQHQDSDGTNSAVWILMPMNFISALILLYYALVCISSWFYADFSGSEVWPIPVIVYVTYILYLCILPLPPVCMIFYYTSLIPHSSTAPTKNNNK